jgi:NitT/TauT family transport system substrate-binding protein
MVLARNSLIVDKAPTVQAFVDGSMAGWKSYIDGDAAPGNALIRKDNPEMAQDVLDQARAKLKSYGVVESGDAVARGIGAMTDARWQSFYNSTRDVGINPPNLDVKKAYDLRFINKRVGLT